MVDAREEDRRAGRRRRPRAGADRDAGERERAWPELEPAVDERVGEPERRADRASARGSSCPRGRMSPQRVRRRGTARSAAGRRARSARRPAASATSSRSRSGESANSSDRGDRDREHAAFALRRQPAGGDRARAARAQAARSERVQRAAATPARPPARSRSATPPRARSDTRSGTRAAAPSRSGRPGRPEAQHQRGADRERAGRSRDAPPRPAAGRPARRASATAEQDGRVEQRQQRLVPASEGTADQEIEIASQPASATSTATPRRARVGRAAGPRPRQHHAQAAARRARRTEASPRRRCSRSPARRAPTP